MGPVTSCRWPEARTLVIEFLLSPFLAYPGPPAFQSEPSLLLVAMCVVKVHNYCNARERSHSFRMTTMFIFLFAGHVTSYRKVQIWFPTAGRFSIRRSQSIGFGYEHDKFDDVEEHVAELARESRPRPATGHQDIQRYHIRRGEEQET